MKKHLNIVSFNIPFPASYGGVIDVFFKLKALHECGVKIILHTFEYGRAHTEELNKYCEEVHYYQRKTGFSSQLTKLPYIVNSRKSKKLLVNLLKNDYPILFEGLHTCSYLDHPRLQNRLKLVRAHNIEHSYYKGLSHNTDSLYKKLYMFIESHRLRFFEKKLKYADYILPLSTTEAGYFHHKYGDEKTVLIPLFHPNEQVEISKEYKSYVLYHGDLSTPENIRTAHFLIDKIIKKDERIPWIIAGLNPDESIYKAATRYKNLEIKANLSNQDIRKLIGESAINVLFTNQTSGVKLKLINSLYLGHYCLANKKMLDGSGLDHLCIAVPDKPAKILECIKGYLHEDFPESEVKERKQVLSKMYDNHKNAQKIIGLLP
jgi:hypothetical protein